MSAEKPQADGEEPQEAEDSSVEWAARQSRETSTIRLGCGLLVGLVLAVMLLARFGGGMPWYVTLPIVAGCVIACVAHFTAEDDRLANTLEWLLFPEFKILSGIPIWLIAVFCAVFFALLLGFAGVLVFSRLA